MTNYYIYGPQPPEDDEGYCVLCGEESPYQRVCRNCIEKKIMTICDELGININEVADYIEDLAEIAEERKRAQALLGKYRK